eukprot:459240-Rhodomonas_salina.1
MCSAQGVLSEYGPYYASVWAVLRKCMGRTTRVYGPYYASVWAVLCECMGRTERAYGPTTTRADGTLLPRGPGRSTGLRHRTPVALPPPRT